MKYLSMLLIVLCVSPQIALANPETNVALHAVADARRDAESNTSMVGWFAAGFCFSIFGVAFAYIHESSVPVGQLMGKSPEYVTLYADEYRSAARQKQLGAALGGCVFGVIASITLSLMQSIDNY